MLFKDLDRLDSRQMLGHNLEVLGKEQVFVQRQRLRQLLYPVKRAAALDHEAQLAIVVIELQQILLDLILLLGRQQIVWQRGADQLLRLAFVDRNRLMSQLTEFHELRPVRSEDVFLQLLRLADQAIDCPLNDFLFKLRLAFLEDLLIARDRDLEVAQELKFIHDPVRLQLLLSPLRVRLQRQAFLLLQEVGQKCSDFLIGQFLLQATPARTVAVKARN